MYPSSKVQGPRSKVQGIGPRSEGKLLPACLRGILRFPPPMYMPMPAPAPAPTPAPLFLGAGARLAGGVLGGVERVWVRRYHGCGSDQSMLGRCGVLESKLAVQELPHNCIKAPPESLVSAIRAPLLELFSLFLFFSLSQISLSSQSNCSPSSSSCAWSLRREFSPVFSISASQATASGSRALVE